VRFISVNRPFGGERSYGLKLYKSIMVIALAGRRISDPGSEVIRFAWENVEKVRDSLRTFFASIRPKVLVSSGACGADLLALEVAGNMGILRSIVLPFDPAIFKTSSVTDRPGDWGPLFDKICHEVAQEEKIQVHGYAKNDDAKYLKTNVDILQRAEALAEKYGVSKKLMAVIVWEGKPKGSDDATADFKSEALKRNFEIKEISTL
jgi:hypothetical protein